MRFVSTVCRALLFMPLTGFAAPAAPGDPVPVAALPGEAITESEIRGLLAKLADMQAKQDAVDRAALADALKALRAACVGPTEAVSLYMASVRVVEFEKMGKKQADFDDWKKRNDDKLHDIPFGQMLILQYGFLKLALESDTEEKCRAAGPKLVVMADDYIRMLPKLGAYGKTLGDDVFSNAVAQRYGLAKRKPEGWPVSPLNLAAVHAYAMRPVRRDTPKDLPAMWDARIRQERALHGVREDIAKVASRKTAPELFGKKMPKNEPPAPVEDSVALKGEKFDATVLPKLLWEMGEDCYRSGLRRRGVDTQFSVITKYPNHPARADWLKSLAEKASAVAAESGVPVPGATATPAVAPDTAATPEAAPPQPKAVSVPVVPVAVPKSEDEPELPTA